MSQPRIIMYTRPGCSDVARATFWMRRKDVTWEEIDIEQDAQALEKVKAWTGREATPTLWIGQTMLVEPDEAEINAALAKEAKNDE